MLKTDLEAELLALGRRIGALDPMGWLHDRWKFLDEVSPQLVTVDADHLRTADSRGLAWVPADLVAHVDDDGGWGEVNTRPETYRWFMNALIAADERSISDWICSVGHPPLLEMPGPYGPLYHAGDDGRHRAAILKALRVTWEYDVAPQRGLVVGEQFGVLMNPPIPDHLRQERRRHDQVLRDQLDQLELLGRAGLVEPVGAQYAFGSRTFVVTAALPFPWALQRPAAVAAASRRYRQSYPQFGSTETEQASLDAGTWSRYLAA